MGYWAATQVKGLSPETTIVSVADVVHLCGRLYSHNRYWRGYESPAGSKTVARYQMDSVGTWEAHNAPLRVWAAKPIDGKVAQMVLWESDQLIVVMKQGNACGAKGLAGEPWEWGHFLQTQSWVKEVNKTNFHNIPLDGVEVFLKSRKRENRKPGSVRGFVVDSK